MESLLSDIRKCTICLPHLAYGVNPVLAASPKSKIAIIGQAPGKIVHNSSIPWDDKSGDRLRQWLSIDKETFYNPEIVAIVPMGFCYPGKGKSGDLPPRKECAPKWHEALFEKMDQIELTILIGSYAQAYYLKENRKRTLTETIKNYQAYLPGIVLMPHPSPRNNIWLKKNPWFLNEVVPVLQKRVSELCKK